MLALALLLGAATLGAHAQPAFRSAASAAVSNAPVFRSAASASYAAEPRFRASASAATDTATLTINRPTGTVANDMMIAAIGVRPSTATISAPSGWTLVRRTDNGGSGGASNSLAVFRRTAGASEPASYAWDVTGATQSVGGIQSFANVDISNPIDAEAGQITASALTHATPSITTSVAKTMLVTAHTFGTSTTWTAPSGMSEGFDRQFQPVASNEGQSIEASYALQSSAGSSGAKTATASGGSGAADPGVTHILALRPPAPAITINAPAGTAENDVMVAAIAVRPASATIGAPSGWTLVRRVDNTSNQTNSLAVYRKIASASEPVSHQWTLGGATFAAAGIQSFSNVDTANPIDVEAGQATPYSLSHATQSVTTTLDNAMIVTAHAFATSTTWSPPTGMTEAYDAQYQPIPQGQGHSIEGNHVLQATAGATGIKTASAAGVSGDQDDGNAHVLALRPNPTPILTIIRPAATAANDVLIAAIGVRPSSASVTAPFGWTLVRRIDSNPGQSNSNSLAVYRKVADGSEPASYAWEVAGAANAAGGVQAFSGVDTASPIDVESGQATTSALSHATPSVTTTSANVMLVTAHTFATSTNWSPPSGMSEGFDTQFQPVPANQGQSIQGNYALQAIAGATGAKTATASGGAGAEDPGATHILALRAATAVVSQLYFVHTDHLNTPRLIADSTGAAVWRWDQQEPFGVSPPDKNPSGLGVFEFPLRHPGQYDDPETGLFYNYFRDCYDPVLGRYCQSDPVGLDGGINTYVYASLNPLSLIDPDGLLGRAPGTFGTGGSTYQTQGNVWGGFTPQNATCDFPMINLNPCVTNCCKAHDDCFNKYKCNWSSWFGNMFGTTFKCQGCNTEARKCIVNAISQCNIRPCIPPSPQYMAP